MEESRNGRIDVFSQVVVILLDHSGVPYGIPDQILYDNGTNFINKFFFSLYPFLRAKLTTTTLYHPR